MGILDEVKSVAKTIQQIDNIELYQKILNLQADIMEVLEENNKLKGEIIELNKKLNLQENLVFRNNAYWLEGEGKKQGPYCSNCWDSKKLLVNLITIGNTRFPECPHCKTRIEI